MRGITFPDPDNFTFVVVQLDASLGAAGQTVVHTNISVQDTAKEIAAYGFDRWTLEDWLMTARRDSHAIIFDIEDMKKAKVFPKEERAE